LLLAHCLTEAEY